MPECAAPAPVPTSGVARSCCAFWKATGLLYTDQPRVRHRRVVRLDRPEPGLVQANRRRTVRSARPVADGGGVVPAWWWG